MLNVLILGTGGVGAMVAYGISYTNKSHLSLIVRSSFEKVKREGFDINSVDYGTVDHWIPETVYRSIEEAAKSGPVFDYIVISTKNCPDIVKLEDMIEPIVVDGKTSIVLFQNGIEIERPFFKKYPNNIVISGVTFIGSDNKHGKVTQHLHDYALVSYFENPNLSDEIQEKKTKEFIEIYNNEKIDITYHPNTKYCRYQKIIYNAALNTTACLTGVDTGRLYMAGATESIVVPAMREVVKIAKADGVTFPENIIDETVRRDQSSWYSPSMLLDHKHNNPIELEIILGNLVTRAHELNIEIPILTLLYDLLKVVQFKLKEANGYITLPKERPIHDKVFK